MRKYSKYIIALICLAIVIVRLIFPNLNFDVISLALISIATLVILVKEPENIFEKTKKLKLGSFEWELQELSNEVKQVGENISKKRRRSGISGPAIYPQNNNSLNTYKIEVQKLTVEIEEKLNEIFKLYFKTDNQSQSTFITIEKLKDANVINIETFEMLRRFLNLQNKIIHNSNQEVTKNDLLLFQDNGRIILNIINTIKNNNSEGLPHYRVN